MKFTLLTVGIIALFNVVCAYQGGGISLRGQDASCNDWKLCASEYTCKNNKCKKKDGKTCSSSDDCAVGLCNTAGTCGLAADGKKCKEGFLKDQI